MKKQTPEALVLAACRQVLQARGVAFWRINTGATKTADRFIRYGSVGFSDIVACIGGRFVAIECKAPKGKQSEAQAAFQAEVERAGGSYWLVKSSEDLERLLWLRTGAAG